MKHIRYVFVTFARWEQRQFIKTSKELKRN